MRSAALSLLGITVLLLFLSHTFFFPAPAAAPVVHPKVSLLHGGHIPPEPDHRTKTKAPPSASPAAASAAGTPAAADSRSTPPTVGATGTGAPGLGGHGPFGPESVAPYMPHGQEDRRCVPRREQALLSRPLNLTVPADSAEWPINCASFDGAAELCAAVKTAAVRREVMVGVANSNVQGQLAKWIEANRRAGISNMLIVAIDDRLPQWLESQKVACWPRPDKALGSHKISAQKFKFVRSFLTVGASVLMTDIDVVYLQNPFDHLWRDADIEGTTDGWDDGSAYGWLEQLDDPSLGAYGRFRPAMRITAWNSGLWYAAATHASLRLMTILAYRMEHEPNTWDQAAFGEEVARPARDGHHAAGIVKRALSYWCFANSKTVFRRLRAEGGSTHRPVVVHANYHQPKQPRMDAVYDRWHLGQADALGRFSTEPTAVVPAPELEANSLHSINDGFVSGSDTRNALAAVKGGGCRPQPSLHGVRVSVAVLPVMACDLADAVCSAASDVAVRRGGGSSPPELLLLVVGASEAEPARLFLQSAAAAGVKNVLVASDGLVAALQGQGVTVVDASSDVPSDASDASRVVRLRWALVRRLVEHGYGVLSAAAPTHLVSDPFDALYRDADVEAMTVGWDDASSYGYNHVIDDPSMGFTRFCHGSRIVGYEPRLFFAMPTAESARLARRMGERLGSAGSEGAARGGEAAGGSACDRVARDEREAFVRELWLPSRNEYAHPGAVLRVMNYLCFVNSKVLARQGQRVLASHQPVLVHIDYHADALPRLRAAAGFLAGQADSLRQLTAADTTTHAAARLPCAGAREWSRVDEAAPAVRAAVERSPWSWGGVPGFVFEAGGRLSTPWGPGQWGLHRGFEAALFADFIGTAHNIELSAGIAVATRCADDNIVLMRSVKGLDLPK